MTNNQKENFVSVILEGLMICCINSKLERFEAALLRQKEHDFTIRIAKFKDGEKIEDKEYTDIPLEDITIHINALENPDIKGVKLFKAETFERDNEEINDKRDFRWIVDLEGEEFHDNKLIPTGESGSRYEMPLNQVYIQNAEFLTSGITNYTYDKIEIDPQGNRVSRELFGKTGFALTSVINADKVAIQFNGCDVPSFDAVKNEGFTYKIYISNLREGGDMESELPVYYKVVKSQSGRLFDLERTPDEEVELYYGKMNCYKIFLSKTDTIDDLA